MFTGIHPMLIPTRIFSKVLDGLRSFSDIFLLKLHSNRLQIAVSFHKLFLRVPCFGWDLEIFSSGYTPRVFQRSFS